MKRSVLKNLFAVLSWRNGRTEREGGVRSALHRIGEASDAARTEPLDASSGNDERNWLYVGNDEEGTPIFLDKTRIVHQSGSASVQVWLKHVPSKRARSLQEARKYLKETGHDRKSFYCIEQLIELDPNRDLITDLALSFFDRSGRLIEEVQFYENNRRPFGTDDMISAIKETITRLIAQSQHRSEPSTDAEPSIDEKIELKLQEINSVLEAFDTCDETKNVTSVKSCNTEPSP